MTAELIIQPGLRIAVPDDGIVLGRNPPPGGSQTYRIDHKAASTSHCRIWRDSETWFVQDLDSTNGTYVNDEAVLSRRTLRGRDVLRLGYGDLVALVASFHTTPGEDPPEPRPHASAPRRPEPSPRPQDEDLRRDLDEMRQELARARAECEEVRAKSQWGEIAVREARLCEQEARDRAREARRVADESANALVQARNDRTEAIAVQASLKRDLAAAHERIARYEAVESEALRSLRVALDERQRRCQTLERENGELHRQHGDDTVALRNAREDRDRLLIDNNDLRVKNDELSEIVRRHEEDEAHRHAQT